MSAKIIDGRVISQEIRDELKVKVEGLKKRGINPGLAFVLVGDNPASISYVRSKNQGCEEVGVNSQTFQLPAETSQQEVIDFVKKLNEDPIWNGILVQLPLPKHISEDAVIDTLSLEKDVDGIHAANLGRLLRGEATFKPATPAGVQQLLVRSGYDPAGKHVVICGRSNIVGKPLAAILMQKAAGANATVTICHTRTPNVAEYTLKADILVAAMGVPRAITVDMVRPGTVVIDVGNNKIEDASRKSGFRLVGDVDFDPIAEIAEAITPVPGGVGPMTVTMVVANTVLAAEGL